MARQNIALRQPAGLFFILIALSGTALGQMSPETAQSAKKEGEVMLYGAVTIEASKPIGGLFEKRYGIKLKHWRGDATDIINRITTEARAGKHFFDVVLGNETVMTTINDKGFLDVFDPPSARGLPNHIRQPDHRMTPWRVLPYGINFNSRRLKPDQAPKTWEDLLHPRWKKKFTMANPGIHVTTLQFVLSLEKILGAKWLSVVEGWARQEPRLTRGLAEGVQALTSGEVPVAISYIKDKFQYAGPIEYVRMNQYLASVSFIGVNRRASHPNAARLFADFFLGPDAQQIFGNLGEYVFHPQAEHRFKRDVHDDQIVVMKLPTKEEIENWGKKFRQLFR